MSSYPTPSPNYTGARRVIDVLVDIVTLMALTIAGIGHVGPWFQAATHYNAWDLSQYKETGPGDLISDTSTRQATREAAIASEKANLEKDLKVYQTQVAIASGIPLGSAAVLILLSLLMPPGIAIRKFMVLLLFLGCVGGLCMLIMPFSPYGWELPGKQAQFHDVRESWGWIMALIGTSVATLFCFVRMFWTMTATRSKS